MSVVLSQAPAEYSFSADKITAGFSCNNLFQVAGVKAVNEIEFTTAPAGQFVIQYGMLNIVMKPAINPDLSGNEFLANTVDANLLLPYFKSNYLLSRDFDIALLPNNKIRFTAKEAGSGFNMFPLPPAARITNNIAGVNEILKPNYSVLFRLYCEKADYSGFEKIYEGNFQVTYGSDGTIQVPVGDKLHDHISKDLRTLHLDIPESRALLCNKSCRRYYFDYAESYGELIQVFKVQRSDDFTVLHGGLSYVAQFKDTLQNLLAPDVEANDRFLKQGNDQSYTRSNQPEYLYFFNTRDTVAGVKVQVKFSFTDGGDYTRSELIEDFQKHRKYAFNFRFDQLFNLSDHPGKTVQYYEVWLEDTNAVRKSETRTYHLNYQYREFVRYFLSWSSFGSLDTRVCYGKGNSEFELFQKQAAKILQMGYDIKDGNGFSYDLKVKSSWKVATGWLTKHALLGNRDFFLSAFKYRYSSGLMLPIKIDSQKIPEIEEGNNLFSQLFEYSYLFDDHAYSESDQEDSGISSESFFFSSGPVENPTGGLQETDPTVPTWVKAITIFDIARWNNNIAGLEAKFVTISGDQIFTYSNDIYKTVDKESIELIATENNFVAEPINRIWEYKSSIGWLQIPDTFNTLVYTLPHDSNVFGGTDSVTIRYKVGELMDVITVVKLYSATSPIIVNVTSDFGDTLFPGNNETTLRAVVSYGDKIITDEIPAHAFTWGRISDDPEGDLVWAQNEGTGVKQVNIDDSEVSRSANFYCEVNYTL